MTNNELLMRMNAQMYGTLQQCSAAIDAYFDGLGEDQGCEPFISPSIGDLVSATLNDVERATEEEAREFFDAARRRARDPHPYPPHPHIRVDDGRDICQACGEPMPPAVTMADLEAGAKIINDANARETDAQVGAVLNNLLNDIKAQFPEASIKVMGFGDKKARPDTYIGVRLTPEEAAAVAGIARYGNGPASQEEIRQFRNLGNLLERELVKIAEADKA